MELDGARVLITGGTRGIGRAMAAAFTEAGATVAVTARSVDPETLGVACDLAEPDSAASLARWCRETLGGLDVLVHNAGVQRAIDLTAGVDAAAFDVEVALNLLAPMRLTAALLPLLRASDRAAIVNVTSILALAPKASAPAYCATKAGLRSWTKALRAQLAPEGVRVVELVPPLVKTAMTEGRDDGAVPPEAVADALVRGLRRGRGEIRVGKARVFSALHRLAPGAAERMMIGN